ncbi:MAG TPA: hypothetical protein VF444_18095 [Pseudonocardiaceae bacterium]
MPRTSQEIIDQQDELARQFEEYEPENSDWRDPESMFAMRRAVAEHARAEAELAKAVAEARAAHYSWATIGAFLGTSGEAARRRYGHQDRDPGTAAVPGV